MYQHQQSKGEEERLNQHKDVDHGTFNNNSNNNAEEEENEADPISDFVPDSGRIHSHSLDEKFLSFLELIVLNSFVGAYGLIQVSMFMLILPKEVQRLFPGNEAVGLAAMLGMAGATQLICPVAGLLSDRTVSPFGRRRPFIVIGTLISLLALAVLWHLSTYIDDDVVLTRNLYILAFETLNIALNICFAAYSGLIPDFVSSNQLGEASGIMAVMTALGSLTGVWLIGFMSAEPFSLYAIWLSICCLLTLIVVKEDPSVGHTHEPLKYADIFAVYFEPLQNDKRFFWVWVSRLLYYMGISVQVYMQYFIADCLGVGREEAKRETALVSITMLAATSISAVPCGMLSDKIGRKPLVYISCFFMAIVFVGFSLSAVLWQILAWSTVFGLANGAYLSTEYALACDVIPDKEQHAASALGVWGIASFLGSTFGPLISGPFLYFAGSTDKMDRYSRRGYTCLLLVGALFVIGSSIALTQLKEKERAVKT